MRYLRSFYYAFQGIAYGIRQEWHMRFHLMAALYTVAASLFFSFSAVRYAVLFLIIGVVIALELVNTAIERVADEISTEYRYSIKVIKDVAAGAVLVAAIAAVAIAVVLFWQPAGWLRMFDFFAVRPWWLLVLAVALAGSILFVGWGGGVSKEKENQVHKRRE